MHYTFGAGFVKHVDYHKSGIVITVFTRYTISGMQLTETVYTMGCSEDSYMGAEGLLYI